MSNCHYDYIQSAVPTTTVICNLPVTIITMPIPTKPLLIDHSELYSAITTCHEDNYIIILR